MGEATFGKYRLIAELGHGGMADVFLAVQAGPIGSGFRKLTVIKRLRQNLAEEPEFVAMLVDEARIAARLNHPNVVQTNEVGQVGSHYFIAMEYLDGQPMHRIQHRSTQRLQKGAEPLVKNEQQYIIVMDALAGLHHAHELADFDGTPLQIVHRDMTPHNIFVTYAGQVKVVDFGIAKAAGRASETRQGVVKGKVRYMAPEQAIGQSLDRRADVFSMGVILWEIATGRRMWKDKDDLAIVHDLVGGNIPISPRSVNPDVPEALDRICQKALAPKVDDRYANAEDFRADLEQYLAESGQLVDARRKLAPSVSELFSDKRSEIRNVIEKQLALLDEKQSGEFQAVPIPPDSLSGSTPISLPSAAESSPLSITSSTTSGVTNHATEIYDPSKSKKPQGRFATRALMTGAAIAAAIGVVVLVSRRPSTAATTVAAPTTISVKLNATPSHARVTIDESPARAVPLETTLPKDEHDHVLKIEADGFQPRVETVRFGSDVAMSFDLKPVDKPAASAEKKPQKPAAPTGPTVAAAPAWKPTPAAPKQTAEPAVAPPTPPPPTQTAAAPPAPPDKHNGPVRKEPDKGDPWATK